MFVMTLGAKLLDFLSELTGKEQDCFAVILKQSLVVGRNSNESLMRAESALDWKTQFPIHVYTTCEVLCTPTRKIPRTRSETKPSCSIGSAKMMK